MSTTWAKSSPVQHADIRISGFDLGRVVGICKVCVKELHALFWNKNTKDIHTCRKKYKKRVIGSVKWVLGVWCCVGPGSSLLWRLICRRIDRGIPCRAFKSPPTFQQSRDYIHITPFCSCHLNNIPRYLSSRFFFLLSPFSSALVVLRPAAVWNEWLTRPVLSTKGSSLI